MSITVPREGEIWQIAVATLGADRLEHLVADLLRSYVRTRSVSNYVFLRREWLGVDALEAVRAGQRRAGMEPFIFEGNINHVTLTDVHRSYLLRGIIQALPLDAVPEDLIEWRLLLDLGV